MEIDEESVRKEFLRVFKSDLKKVQSFDLGRYLFRNRIISTLI
jgi:hypothetical protein